MHVCRYINVNWNWRSRADQHWWRASAIWRKGEGTRSPDGFAGSDRLLLHKSLVPALRPLFPLHPIANPPPIMQYAICPLAYSSDRVASYVCTCSRKLLGIPVPVFFGSLPCTVYLCTHETFGLLFALRTVTSSLYLVSIAPTTALVSWCRALVPRIASTRLTKNRASVLERKGAG